MNGLSADVEKKLRDFALRVELEVKPGECLALVGLTGSGKTSFLKCLVGTMRPERGRVVFGGQTWVDTAAGVYVPPERRHVGYLPQNYALFPHMTVMANVVYGARARGLSRQAALRKARQLLERLGVAELADEMPARLSGGQRQRVALARALASQPRLLVTDEPLAALDAQTRAHVRHFLRELVVSLGLTTIVVSHDPVDALTLGDRVAVMRDGSIVQAGTRREIISNPRDSFVADFLGINLLTGDARRAGEGLTEISCNGFTLYTTDPVGGPVTVTVLPTDITLSDQPPHGSALNVLKGTVKTVTYLGSRTRVAVGVGRQTIAAEVTYRSAAKADLKPGRQVYLAFKASATRCQAYTRKE